MENFAQNLRFVREQKGLNQSQIKELLGFNRTTWNGYETGNSTPNFSDLVKIARYFGITETDLIHSDLKKGKVIAKSNTEKNENLGIVNGKVNGKVGAKTGHSATTNALALNTPQTAPKAPQMPMVITVDSHGNENILFVPIKAQAGYLLGYADPTYIEQLPAFHMPGLNNKTYRMFEVEGLSMAPNLQAGDKVITEWVPSLGEIRENRIHVVFHKNGIAIKRVLNRIDKRGKIYLKSDTISHRANYPLLEIDAEDIIEIWYVRMKVSTDLSEPAEIYSRIADLEINQHEILKKLAMS